MSVCNDHDDHDAERERACAKERKMIMMISSSIMSEEREGKVV